MTGDSRWGSLVVLAGAVVLEALLGVVGWWLAPLLGHRTLSEFFLTSSLPVTLAYGLGGGLVALLVVLAVYSLSPGYRDVIYQDVITQLARIPPIALAIMGVAAALGEEVFFRGFLLAWVGLIPSSILFGALHVSGGRSWLYYGATAGLIGLGLGGLFLATGNLVVPMLAHGSYNLLVTYFIAQDLFEPR